MSTQHDSIARQLKAAIRAGNKGMIRLCELLFGSGTAVEDDDIHEALSVAARKGHVEACRLLCKRLSPRGKQRYYASKTHFTGSPLHEAVERGHFEVARLLIEEFHLNINQKDVVGDTPLFYACRYSLELSQYLLEHGAHVNRGGTLDGYGSPSFGPLWFAVQEGTRNVVCLLLQHGADPNFNRPAIVEEGNDDTNQEWNPRNTDHAIQNGNAEILSLLLQYGAFVGDGNRDGDRDVERFTSLNSLLLHGQHQSREVKLSICRILIEHSERDDSTAVFMKTSFEIAMMEEEAMEHCSLLLDAGLDRISAMYWAVQAENDAACRLLVHQYQVNPFTPAYHLHFLRLRVYKTLPFCASFWNNGTSDTPPLVLTIVLVSRRMTMVNIQSMFCVASSTCLSKLSCCCYRNVNKPIP